VLEGKGLTVQWVDGSLGENKEQRTKLFGISGKRAVYPQFFILMEGSDEPTFVGDYEEFEGLVECDALDSEVLAANPDIPTFSKVFAALL
jgi:hypothetical protein